MQTDFLASCRILLHRKTDSLGGIVVDWSAEPRDLVLLSSVCPFLLFSMVALDVPEHPTPVRPFEELSTPNRRERPSIQLQFTPMTPLKETTRRLSLVPPKLPVSNRSLVIGTAIFLFLSAIYRSGIIGWTLRMKTAELQGRLYVSNGETSFAEEAVPMALYESTLAEVEHLYAKVIALETFQSAFSQQCLARDREYSDRADECAGSLSGCISALDDLTATHANVMNEYQNSIVQLEVEQIQVIEKIESDFEWRLNNLLNAKINEVQELEDRIYTLVEENEILRNQFDLLSIKKVVEPETTPAPTIEVVAEASPEESFPSPVEEIETAQTSYQIAVFILSFLVALLSAVSGALFLMKRPQRETIVIREEVLVPGIDSTAIEERDPWEEERMQMALEDMAAKIAREVKIQLEMIEAHHEREMQVMRAIVEETHKTTAEIGSLVKDVLEETSIVSTCNNSPCMSPSGDSCSIEEGDASSLSVLLETSVTPIRVPIRERAPANKTSSSIPTCYSIASPSRHSRARRDRGHDSSEDEEEEGLSVEEDSDLEKENFARDMVNIWENFKN